MVLWLGDTKIGRRARPIVKGGIPQDVESSPGFDHISDIGHDGAQSMSLETLSRLAAVLVCQPDEKSYA